MAVPAKKFSFSKKPIGPFHRMVPAFIIIGSKSTKEAGAISNIASFSCIELAETILPGSSALIETITDSGIIILGFFINSLASSSIESSISDLPTS